MSSRVVKSNVLLGGRVLFKCGKFLILGFLVFSSAKANESGKSCDSFAHGTETPMDYKQVPNSNHAVLASSSKTSSLGYNLVRAALQKIPEYSCDEKLAAFLVNFLGTIIIGRQEGACQVLEVPGYADNLKFTSLSDDAHSTSEMQIDHTFSLEPSRFLRKYIDGYTYRAQEMIKEIQSAYVSSTKFSDKHIHFINDSRVPVYKYIQVATAAKKTFLTPDVLEYIVVTCLLDQYDKVCAQLVQDIASLGEKGVDTRIIMRYYRKLLIARYYLNGFVTQKLQNAVLVFYLTLYETEKEIKLSALNF